MYKRKQFIFYVLANMQGMAHSTDNFIRILQNIEKYFCLFLDISVCMDVKLYD